MTKALHTSADALQKQIDDLTKIVDGQAKAIQALQQHPSDPNKLGASQSLNKVSSNGPVPERRSAAIMWLCGVHPSYTPDTEAQPPIFKPFERPHSERPAEWLKDCVQLLMDRKVDQSHWPVLISGNFKGPHKAWWNILRFSYPEGKVPWAVFCTEFIDQFKDCDKRREVYDRLPKLQQRAYGGLEKLIYDFRTLLEITKPDEGLLDVMRSTFLNILPKPFFEHLILWEDEEPSDTMEELFHQAVEYEREGGMCPIQLLAGVSLSPDDEAANDGTRRRRNGRCPKCGVIGHPSWDCKSGGDRQV